MIRCPNCNTPLPPSAVQPPPVQVDVDSDVDREIKNVGRFGAIMTAILLSFGCVIVAGGALFTVVMGCCGACANYGQQRSAPPQVNPFASWIWPGIAGLVIMWVVLAIVIFVIRGRRQK